MTVADANSPIVLPDDPSFGPEVQVDYPGYRSTRWRAPKRPLVSLPEDGRPVPNALVEVWQANAAGRYRHDVDRHPAPLDPNFSGAGRCLTDEEGRYRVVTVKPGAYPWGNHENAWRPAHIHFSIFGRLFTPRLVTQMYFPGDPLFPYDPIFNSVRDPRSRDLLIARFDLDATQPDWALAFESRDLGPRRSALGAERHGRGRPLRLRRHEAGSASRAGTAARRLLVRTRAAQAPADADLLPGRERGERDRPGALRARPSRPRDVRRRSGRGCVAVRSPHAGRRGHRLLRALTTFAALFVPARPREAVSDAAWLAAMLHVERALAHAESRIGVVPAEAAAAIADCCDPTLYDIERLCEEGRAVGNPAEPLARALRERVGGDAARFVHFGATSQDVLDTAAMLVARDARALIEEERRCRARVRTAGAGGSRDADGGAHAAARSGADDVRAQGGRLACRHARGAGAPHYRGARRARPPGGSPRSARAEPCKRRRRS